MQALRHPGSAPLADATWQELVPLTTKLFYEKSGLLWVVFFFFFGLIINIMQVHCRRFGKCGKG